MDNDLDRSVRLLEDALSPGTGLLKNRTPRKYKDISFDLSLTLAPHEIKRIMTNNETLYDETITTILHADKSVTGNVIQSNTPWKTAIDSLYNEFFAVLQNHLGTYRNILSSLL